MKNKTEVTHEMLAPLERSVVEDIAVLLQKLVNELEGCLQNEKFASIIRDQIIADQKDALIQAGIMAALGRSE